MKRISYGRTAAEELRAAPIAVALKIRAKLESYAENPAAQANNIKAMRGKKFKGLLRLRVGDWRVIFSEEGEVISVQRIGRRGAIYQ